MLKKEASKQNSKSTYAENPQPKKHAQKLQCFRVSRSNNLFLLITMVILVFMTVSGNKMAESTHSVQNV